MKKYRLIALIITAFVGLTACSDFLEERSQDEIIPSTVTDFREVLLNYIQTGGSPAIYSMDDDVAIDESQYYSGDNSSAIFLRERFTWQPEVESGLEWEYTAYYENIKAMNAILENIDEAEGDETEREMVKAQALGARAYYYFVLVNMFGEPYNHNRDALGVVLKLNSEYTDDGLVRTTVEEVYAQIVEDLETASEILNSCPKQRGDFLMNSTAADILLSRVYLYMEEWDNAIAAAERAIGSAEGLYDYTLLPEGEQFYMTTYDNTEVEWLFGSVSMPSSLLTMSTGLLSLYDEDDRRPEFLPGTYSGIAKIDATDGGPTIMIRSAEAYLNRAEARVQSATPDLTGALADLNELRRYRITDYQDVTISDAATLLEEIRNERRKELCYEGHRWFDLRRYGMPSISHDFRINLADPLVRYTLAEEDPFYTLPFPQSVMEQNIRLEQNPSAFMGERNGQPIN